MGSSTVCGSGVRRGVMGFEPPPPNRKKCRKMRLFRNAIFLATKIQFLIEFSSKISKIFSHFPKIFVFRPNARKSNAWFVRFFEKYAKITDVRNFLNNLILKTFANLSKIPNNL